MESREATAKAFKRAHQNACYPYADDRECSIAAIEIEEHLSAAGFTIMSKEDVEAVRKAMDKVIEFDWSDNDDDAVLALYDLYAAIRSLKSSTA